MSGTEDKIHVLYVDDEVVNLTAFKATFRRKFIVYTAVSAVEGREILEHNKIDVIISDHLMPGIKGLDFLKSIRTEFPKSIRMLLTGFANPEAIREALEKNYTHNCIYKPWDSDSLTTLIENAVA